MRHDLTGTDLADALGVPVNQAHALASRARAQLERSLGALLVARTGRKACAELDAILAGWDGTLTSLLRKRISRHIEQLRDLRERKRRELSPAMLFGVLPLFTLPRGCASTCCDWCRITRPTRPPTGTWWSGGPAASARRASRSRSARPAAASGGGCTRMPRSSPRLRRSSSRSAAVADDGLPAEPPAPLRHGSSRDRHADITATPSVTVAPVARSPPLPRPSARRRRRPPPRRFSPEPVSARAVAFADPLAQPVARHPERVPALRQADSIRRPAGRIPARSPSRPQADRCPTPSSVPPPSCHTCG